MPNHQSAKNSVTRFRDLPGSARKDCKVRRSHRSISVWCMVALHSVTASKEIAMKVLMVITSHDQLGDTGRKTGFWLEELAAPYYAFKDARVELVLASPKGGQPPLDPKSNEPDFQTDLTRRFEADAAAKAQLATTVRLDSVKQDDFDSVFY